MNFEILIRQYLYQNKSIALPGMGRLHFGDSTQLPTATSDRYEAIPLQDLHFDYDLQQQAEPEFIKFVSAHTGKIAPLASSDVDSHFMLCKQFINIGKAYIIDGVGTLEKKDDGTYGFTPGTYIPVSDAVTITHKPLKVREPQPVIPKNTAPRGKQVNYKNILLIAGIAVLIGLAAWAAWYFFVQNRVTDTAAAVAAPTDTTASSAATPSGKDTTALAAAPTATAAPTGGPNDYKAVYETTLDKARAIKRTKMLTDGGSDARYEAADSSHWKMYIILKNAAPADTARKRDSLSKFLARRVRLEKL